MEAVYQTVWFELTGPVAKQGSKKCGCKVIYHKNWVQYHFCPEHLREHLPLPE